MKFKLEIEDLDFIRKVESMFTLQNYLYEHSSYSDEIVDKMSEEICEFKDSYITANAYRLKPKTIDYLYSL